MPCRLIHLLNCLFVIWGLAGWSGAVAGAPPELLRDAMAPAAQRGPPWPLVLHDMQSSAAAWPHVSLLSDPGGSWTVADVRQRLADFAPPSGPTSNLGPRRDAVWLRLPLQVASGDGRWVIDIDYPPLNRIELTLLANGQPVLHRLLGNEIAFAQRPLHVRPHAVALQLVPGVNYEVLLRVSTTSSMLLPITLSKPDAFYARENAVQLLQGVLGGVALALLAYSLVNWLSLRDPMFLQYAGLLLGVSTFFISYFGIGQQHFWSEQTGLIAKIAPMSVLLALVAGNLFVASALDTRSRNRWVHRGLQSLSALAACILIAALAGALDYRQTQLLATVIGPLPIVLVVPAAFRQARAGESVAVYMLIGWGAYMAGAVVMAMLLRGYLPVEFWLQHLFQFASLFEMLVWTRVLGLRIDGLRHSAARSELEKQALISLAYTDALTGLPNRRGLALPLATALAACRGDSALALFLLDLDGFKLVNDRLGHDAGDALLVQVGQRMRRQLRHSDVVARLGGDEFVIMATGLAGEAEALALGRKLLDAFLQPFDIDGQTCRVGLTIGFALAPGDGQNAGDLLKRADAAMYAGKQAGRHCIHRGGAALGLAAGRFSS